MKNLIRHIPVPVAGVALGLTALGNLIQSYSEGVRLLCGGIAAVMILLLLTRFLFFFGEVRQEFENPITAGVSATIFMTCMQLASYLYPYAANAAEVLWFASVAGHAALICWFTGKFMVRFRLETIYPTSFITYVGIVVASVTSATFSKEGLGELIFWFGFAAYVVIFIIITYRYLKEPVAESARPLFCIYTAPMSLSLTGYLSAVSETSMVMVVLLEVLAQLLYVIVLTRLPRLLKLPFYPSYAAFTFPFVITAFGLKRVILWMGMEGMAVPEILHVVLAVETIVAVVMVCYTLLRYLAYLLRFLDWRTASAN